ncbi:MAG TPA: 50S ribosomal protein L32 [Candidatus Acidoferrales bacterium]|jgi:large subunit ribosomal protein L32|nr:50S ribosomal protein L32 [Candidatus Acidoferrales bacterium]
MPNPKRRHSHARKNKRRAHDHLHTLSLSDCPNCHEKKLPHQACPHCGQYKGREVIDTSAKTA